MICFISDDFTKVKERITGEEYDLYELNGKYLVPGFIDIHTHGGAGVDTYSKSVVPWMEHKTRSGVTSFLPTLMTIPLEKMFESLKNLVKEIKRKRKISKIIGINMEGPYLNPHYGVQLSENCLIPKRSDYGKFLELSEDYLKIMTIAPELYGARDLIKKLLKNKVIVSIGHTNASMEETEKAVDLGASLATHIFNAFGYSKGLFKETRNGKICGVKEVRALEVLLNRENVYTEVMSDRYGIHVNPILLNLLVKCKGMEKIILITDSMSSAGMPDGKYILPDGRKYIVNIEKDDVIWLKRGSVLGGSILKLKDAAKNFMKHTDISFKDAIKAITINPARLLRIDDEVGSIKVGKKADLTVIDKNFDVYMTLVNGEVVYKNIYKI